MSASSNQAHSRVDLLAYEPFIRSIARSLLKSEDRVGDVVQETWVRALAKPPRSEGSFKSWLGRVARNVALDQHRRDSNRLARERAASREEAMFERERDLEMHGKLVEAVLALAEPYKSVVIARYYRELSPSQIAKELDRKDSTVRAQLHRAHELLKEKLDRKFGGDRSAWMGLCGPLAFGRTSFVGFSLAAKAIGVLVAASILVAAALSMPAWMEASSSEGVTEDTTLAMSDGMSSAAERGLVDSKDDPAQDERTPLTKESSVLVTLGGAPVEGAEVWHLQVSDIDKRVSERHPGIGSDPDLLFPMFGTRSTSGEDGRAPVPSTEGNFAVLAMKGAFFKIIMDESDTLELELEKVAAIRVRTLDAAGQPVGKVPVVLRASAMRSMSSAMRGASMSDLMVHYSQDGSGMALFRAFDKYHNLGEEISWSVRLGVPGVPSQQTNFDVDHSFDEPLTLQLSPTGSMKIRVVDGDGNLVAADGTVLVRSSGPEQATLDMPLEQGVAHYPLVGTGAEFQVAVEIPRLGASWGSTGFGPERAGQTRTLNIELPDAPGVRGQMLNTEGEPLANAQLIFHLLGEQGQHTQRSLIETDAAGRFRVDIERYVLGRRVRFLFVNHNEDGYMPRIESDDFLTLTDKRTDLGVLQLKSGYGFVEGRCVSSDGTPLPRVEVAITQREGFGESRASTDANGRFHLGGLLPDTVELHIPQAREWMLSEPVMVRSGQRDIELVLTRSGELSGMVLVDAGVNPEQVSVTAFATGKAELEHGDWAARATCDSTTGRFRATGLHAGSYTVRVRLQGALLSEIPDVEVTHAAASTDPRVETIDLRGVLSSLRLDVVGRDGQPLRAGRATGRLVSNGEQVAFSTTDEHGVLQVTFPSAPQSFLTVSATDYRSVTLPAESRDEPIVLQPGIAVELSTLQRPVLRGKKMLQMFSLHRVEKDPRFAGRKLVVALPSSLTKSGSASVKFPAPGRYQLHYSGHHFSHSGSVSSVSADRPVPGEFFLDVPESKDTLALDITLPETLPE